MSVHPSAFIHHTALLEPHITLGEGTRVWAFVHILSGARLGAYCNICDHVFIESDVLLGDRVTVKCGVQLWDGLRVDNDVFIGPNVTFTNDMYPPSKDWPASKLETKIHAFASIGGGSVILPGITIGERVIVGAGSVVTKSVQPGAVVVGNPARVIRIT